MIGDRKDHIYPGRDSESGTGATRSEEQQTHMEEGKPEILTIALMEQICEQTNLERAYKRVKANKGAPGIDRITVEEMKGYFKAHKEQLIKELLEGSYKSKAVRGVKIPKPGGGERQLGIPTVVDRMIQQAIAQVLEPIYERGFSNLVRAQEIKTNFLIPYLCSWNQQQRQIVWSPFYP